MHVQAAWFSSFYVFSVVSSNSQANNIFRPFSTLKKNTDSIPYVYAVTLVSRDEAYPFSRTSFCSPKADSPLSTENPSNRRFLYKSAAATFILSISLQTTTTTHNHLHNMSAPLPDQGRLPPSVCRPPSNEEHMFPDFENSGPKAVEIFVVADSRGSSSRDNKWVLAWEVGSVHRRNRVIPVLRHLLIDTENWQNPLYPAYTQQQHVFWGPYTQEMGQTVRGDCESYTIAEVSWQGRQALERVAMQTPVMALDGRWDGQAWVKDLLDRAGEAWTGH